MVAILRHVEEEHAAHALLLQLLEIPRDRLPGDVGVEPPPIRPGLGHIGRSAEALLKGTGLAAALGLIRIPLGRAGSLCPSAAKRQEKNEEASEEPGGGDHVLLLCLACRCTGERNVADLG